MNPNVRIKQIDLLSDNWYTLKKYTLDYRSGDGTWEEQQREAYDRGNGAAILLYNRKKQTVVLTRQFRLPTYINGNASGMLIEACAGLLDQDSPEECIQREAGGNRIPPVGGAQHRRSVYVTGLGNGDAAFIRRGIFRRDEDGAGRRTG